MLTLRVAEESKGSQRPLGKAILTTVRVDMPKGSDVRVYYDDVSGNTITRTLAMRYADGGSFAGEVTRTRRILIEESK